MYFQQHKLPHSELERICILPSFYVRDNTMITSFGGNPVHCECQQNAAVVNSCQAKENMPVKIK